MAADASSARAKLAGRHIVVTGAASGIGNAIARLFHEEGAKLALIDREGTALPEVAKELGAVAIALDLADASTLAPAVEKAAREMGGLDGLVNCAAFSGNGDIEDIDMDRLMRAVNVNLVAPFLLCKAAAPHLRKAKGSAVVNIASGLGILPNAKSNTAYSATKGGLVAFSKALAAELAPEVRVNVVAPGITNTPMAAFLFENYANPSDAPWVKQYALQRIAEPIEIARAVLFLISDDSSFVTGIALAVDGGRTFH